MMVRLLGRERPGTTVLVAVLVFGLLVGPSTVAAQEAAPSVDLADTSIEIDAGETSTVTAEYEFDVAAAGSGESALTEISGTMWTMPDREIGDIAATVNGESAEVSVTENDRHLGVSVPVSDVADGDTVTVTLEYEVTGPAGELKTPLWVPEYSTAGEANVVDVAVTLPQGETVSGGAFPSPTAVDGNSANYELLHVPGYVAMAYGESGTGLLTADTAYSIVGVAVIVGFVVGGLAIDRRTA
jgi:hypothetical protein